MKIFIEDNDKISKYELPKDPSESFLITYKPENSKNEYSINIESKENEWILKSNGLVDVLENGNLIDEAPLKDYYSYALKINGEDYYRILYCFPYIEEKSLDASVLGINQITIGSDISCNICYNSPNLSAVHVTINHSSNGYVLNANDGFVFLNSKPVSQSILKTGDSIFVRGLKIIWMDNFVRICNSPENININGLSPYKELEKYDYTNHGSDDSKDKFFELYDPKLYFYHTPRIRNYITKEKIKIDEPPLEEQLDKTPTMLTIGGSITMISSSFVTGYSVVYGMTNGTRTLLSSIPSIMMCICILIGGLLIPRLAAAYRKKQKIKKEKLRQVKYSGYLIKKGSELKELLAKQSTILNFDFPSSVSCCDIIMNRKPMLWSKKIIDDDFLKICVGTGNIDANIEINAPEDKFVVEEDKLRNMVVKLAEDSKTLKNVPITYSLLDNRLSSIICNLPNKMNFINNYILQLITFHSAADLKLVFFLEKYNADEYDYVKYLPHVLSEDKEVRFFATDYTESKEVSEYLENIYKERVKYVNTPNKDSNITIDKTNKYKNFDSYYLIITDCYSKIKDINFIKTIIKSEDNYGFSCMFIEDGLSDLPAECKMFTYIKENTNYIIEPVEKENKTTYFNVRDNFKINMQPLVYKLANIPIAAKEAKKELPTSLTFLDMYNVSKIEQLNILNRWAQNDAVTSLKTPIGVHADRELFMLDLHEKAHGPHGLIAGSTGSGKSEFIITFILSMAINYSPNEVQFVLIDYKGGGLAGAFENRETGLSLPHLAGTITNLDTAEMNRTLVSINSELKRRQKIFAEVRDKLGEGTIDIYKYQRLYKEGLIEEPVAHLFIISDEFAELKSQQPEFMQELISTSRIGRSLGVHLILATQKPSGVVNDQIWANSKFKVCLKVQDRSDSMEMLKRPEAASIKEPGRFYLQVGYDEYFELGQSGYSGAQYIPSDTIIKKVNNELSYISNTGNIIKSVTDDEKTKTIVKSNGDQLTNIVKYVISIAKKQKVKTKKLWLNSIPENITLEILEDKYLYEPKEYYINPVIGEYDNPSKQEQGLLTLDLTGKGHSLIYGMAGSGKENLLTTLIASSCINHSPEEVNFYIFDFGAETLRIFTKFPHVGVVATADEEQKIMDTLVMIDEEAGRRRDLFVDYAGSYQNYIKESGEKLPLIVIVINAYEVFMENYPRLAEAIYPLIREGSKYGITFVLSTATNSSIRMRMTQLFTNKLTLWQNNPEDYRSVIGSPRGLVPKKFFGRGLVATDDGALEFQTAYVTDKSKINSKLRELASELKEKYPKRARRIMNMPEVVTTNIIREEQDGLKKVPVGINKVTKDTEVYDFDTFITTMILSDNILDKMNFISAIVSMIKDIDNTKVTIIDAKKIFTSVIDNVEVINNNFDYALSNMIKDINKEADGVKRIFVIIGFNEFKNSIASNYKAYFDSMISNINKFKNAKIIAVDDYNSFKNVQIESWYNDAFNSKYGIWLGQEPLNQMAIMFNDITPEDRKENYPYLAYVNNDGVYSVIKYVIEGDNNG